MRSITAPTLVVHGTADAMLHVDNAPLIASKIAGSQLLVLAGVGHIFWSTDGGQSTAAIAKFLAAPTPTALTATAAAASKSTPLRSRL